MKAGRFATHAVIQSAGHVANVMTMVLVGRLGGPEVQGLLSLAKGFIDLATHFFSLGIPTAITIFINRQALPPDYFQRLSLLLVGSVTVPAFVAASLAGVTTGNGVVFLFETTMLTASVLLSVMLWLLRSAYLTQDDGVTHSLLSVLHIVLMLLVVPLQVVFWSGHTIAALLVIYSTSCAVMWAAYRSRVLAYHQNIQPASFTPVDRRAFVSESGTAFILSLIGTVAVPLTFLAMKASSASLDDVGQFAVATMPYVIASAFFSLLSPLLINSVSKPGYTIDLPRFCGMLALVAVAVQILAWILAPFVEPVISVVFGASFAPAAGPTKIILWTMFAVVMTRPLLPVMQGLGWRRTVLGSSITRFSVLVLLLAGLAVRDDSISLESAAYALTLAEIVGCGVNVSPILFESLSRRLRNR